jgi:hypothetical protein
MLLPHLGEPIVLLRKALVTATESAWDAQLSSLRSIGSEVLCAVEITEHPMAPAVVKYLNCVGAMMTDVARHMKVSAPDVLNLQATTPSSTTTGSTSTSTTSGAASTLAAGIQMSGLETLRHSFIGKLLSDCEPAAAGSRAGDAGLSGKASSLNSASAGFGGTLWGQKRESALRMSAAEKRRREDVYIGFRIAALLGCCVDNDDDGDDGATEAAADSDR